MPSSRHEGYVEVIRNRPQVVLDLLVDKLGVQLPRYVTVSTDAADLGDVQPVDFRADAIVRLGGVDEEVVLAAFASSLVIVDEERATPYSDIVCAVLPEAARQLLEGLLATRTYEYQSDFVRRYVFQGRAEGLAEGRMEGEAIGEVTALLTVLAARRIDLPDEARARITACTDTATLTAWTGRAAIADRIEDVLD